MPCLCVATRWADTQLPCRWATLIVLVCVLTPQEKGQHSAYVHLNVILPMIRITAKTPLARSMAAHLIDCGCSFFLMRQAKVCPNSELKLCVSHVSEPVSEQGRVGNKEDVAEQRRSP